MNSENKIDKRKFKSVPSEEALEKWLVPKNYFLVSRIIKIIKRKGKVVRIKLIKKYEEGPFSTIP
ncbi:MAG: hypothetical protein IT280_04740 [Ignavibacteria bacterium]|nr:hypothetical protein [Ignavibacteria bacterium]